MRKVGANADHAANANSGADRSADGRANADNGSADGRAHITTGRQRLQRSRRPL
jgi:hypothetical protein